MGWLKTRDNYSGLSQAASLGIAILKKTKQNTWQELLEAMEAGDPLVAKTFLSLDLSDAQLDVISAHQDALNLLRINPAATPAVCPKCGHFILVSDSVPSKCMVGSGCEGKPAKIVAATAGKGLPPEAQAAKPAPAAAAAEPEADDADDFDFDDPFA